MTLLLKIMIPLTLTRNVRQCRLALLWVKVIFCVNLWWDPDFDTQNWSWIRIRIGIRTMPIHNIICMIFLYRKLGWGHFSTVWLCWDLTDKKFVALKVTGLTSQSVVTQIRILFLKINRIWILFYKVWQDLDLPHKIIRGKKSRNLTSTRVFPFLGSLWKVPGVPGPASDEKFIIWPIYRYMHYGTRYCISDQDPDSIGSPVQNIDQVPYLVRQNE